jgi:hypothetical protein
MGHPPATYILAALSAVSALASLVITLQFLEVIPWGEGSLDFWGGKWAGVFLFGSAAAIAAMVTYGWLTLKPWAFTITVLAALLGLAVPISALIAGTESWSTALLPVLVNGAVLTMLIRKDVRQATAPSLPAS